MSRFAIDITIYLAIALSQWIITVLIIEKMADPFRNFMDLCSVANISVLAFTHPLRAYYIHGRSIHGMADTDMLEMNMFLQREKENLCGLRGLESNSELQTFIVCLPKSFREKLDELTSAMRNAARTTNVRSTNDRVTTKVETTAKIHAEITQFVKDFIDHTDPNIDYVVTEARLIEDVLDIELSDTSRVGSFIRYVLI
jgi:meckelin